MLKIKEEMRDEIVKAILNSSLPINQGAPIVNVLNGLEVAPEVLPTKEE